MAAKRRFCSIFGGILLSFVFVGQLPSIAGIPADEESRDTFKQKGREPGVTKSAAAASKDGEQAAAEPAEGVKKEEESSSSPAEGSKSAEDMAGESTEETAEEQEPPALFRKANIANRRNNFKEALRLCDLLLAKQPGNLGALSIRGEALVSLKKYKEGVTDLSKVIEALNDPSRFGLYAARALGYLQLDEYGKAIEDCNQAIKAHTKDQQFWLLRGVAYQRSKNYKNALADLNHGMSMDPNGPNLPVFLSSRADVYSAMDEDEDAMKDLSRVIKLTPKDPQAWMNRAYLYIKLKDWEHAVVDLDNVIDFALMGQLSNEALKLRAEAAKKCGKFKTSIEDYSSLLAGYPKEPAFLFGRAEARLSTGELADALKDMNKCLLLDSHDPIYFELRAKIYDALKDPAAAETDRQQAKKLVPSS